MFLTVPVGMSAELHDSHIHSMKVISDHLGGAVPVSIMMGRLPLAMHVREDCATAGLARNPLASMLILTLAQAPIPVLGPAVITAAELIMPSGDQTTVIGQCGCLPQGLAADVAEVAGDLWLALQNRDDLITPRPGLLLTPEEWGMSVRAAAEQLERAPIPEWHPYPKRPRDLIADGLARAGIHVRRGPDADLV